MQKKSIDKEEVISHFNLSPSGGKGWYTASDLLCPECGKGGGKFGIKIVDDSGLVNCWRCNYKDSIFSFLYKTNNYHLVNRGKKYDFVEELDDVFIQAPTNNDLPEEKLPIGFKRIHSNEYLESRGFESWQFDHFKVGITESVVERGWRDKLIFQIFNNGVRVGLLGRSTHSKEWHDRNLAKCKEDGGKPVLRYKNSDGDFSKMVGGLDDITPQTDTIIIVEGLMDKANIDRLINVNNQEFLRCVFMFGSSISEMQVMLLKQFKNIKNVIILFDPDTLIKVREIIPLLQSSFDFTFFGDIVWDVDPGEMSGKQLKIVLDNLKTPDEFYTGKLKKKKLSI